MKILIFVLTLAFTISAQAECPNLTGYFAMDLINKNSRTKRIVLQHFEQQNCEVISIGTLTVANGKIIDEMFPAITYYDRNNPSLCTKGVCYYFESSNTSIRMYYPGQIEFKRSGLINRYSCAYDFVDYSITSNGNLKLSFQFVPYGSDDPCVKNKGYSEEYQRIERPR